jgi:aldehyde dehydrogenase (NAD+)
VCGNTVVWKPAEYTPATAEAFAQLLLHAGLPPGVVNMVVASGADTFAGLERALTDGTLDKIGFTGSTEVGRAIGELAGRHLQTACLELGGKNPLVVMPDAISTSPWRARCSAGSARRGSVHVARHRDRARERARRVPRSFDRPSRPRRSATRSRTCYTADDLARFCERFLGWLELDQPHHTRRGSTGTDGSRARTRARASSATPTQAVRATRRSSTASRWTTTSTNGDVRADRGVASFGDVRRGDGLANGHGYGCRRRSTRRDPLNVFRFRERISAGMVSVNNSTTGAEAHLPFGGNGGAATGRGSPASGCSTSSRAGRR